MFFLIHWFPAQPIENRQTNGFFTSADAKHYVVQKMYFFELGHSGAATSPASYCKKPRPFTSLSAALLVFLVLLCGSISHVFFDGCFFHQTLLTTRQQQTCSSYENWSLCVQRRQFLPMDVFGVSAFAASLRQPVALHRRGLAKFNEINEQTSRRTRLPRNGGAGKFR